MAKQQGRSVRERRIQHQSEQQRRRIIIAAVVVVVVGAIALLVWVRQSNVAPEDVTLPESLSPPPGADGKAWGPVDAPVIIQEFSDFQ